MPWGSPLRSPRRRFLGGLLGCHLGDEGQARFTLSQGDDGLFVALANDRIEFPVPQTGTTLHDGWAFIDGNAVGKLSSAVIGSVALLASLLATQVPMQVAAMALVCQDVLVDPFVADAQSLLLGQPEADLLGTPVLAQQAFYHTPVIIGDAGLGFGLTAICHHLVGLFGTIALLATIPA